MNSPNYAALRLCAEYTQRYQDILLRLPSIAFATEKTAKEQIGAADADRMYGAIRAYIDLCAEQEFLHSAGAIPEGVWLNWEQGIRNMFQLPAIQDIWEAMRTLSGYASLAKLIA